MLRRIISRVGSSDASGFDSSSDETAISTGVSGVRSSWLSTARNRSLAWDAASASSLASSRSASVRLRSVMSSTMNEQSARPEPGDSIGESVAATHAGLLGQVPWYSNRTGRPVARHSRNRSIQVASISGGASSCRAVVPFQLAGRDAEKPVGQRVGRDETGVVFGQLDDAHGHHRRVVEAAEHRFLFPERFLGLLERGDVGDHEQEPAGPRLP